MNNPNIRGSENTKYCQRIAIFLASCNGAKHLKNQLSSISKQTHRNWVLYASDDCSEDSTYDILHNFWEKYPKKVHIFRHTTRQGYTQNFLSLIFKEDIKADFFAFCDQDDEWNPDKLQRGIEHLSFTTDNKPALYGSRTAIFGKNKLKTKLSSLPQKKLSFANALVQSTIWGNTIMFNKKARELILKIGKNIMKKSISHDWSLYLLVSGHGGTIYYDIHPTIKYRKHRGNLIGPDPNFFIRLLRTAQILKGRFRNWNGQNIEMLQSCRELLTAQNKAILDEFSKARKSPLLKRLQCLRNSGVHRQGLLDNTALWLTAFLGKI